MVCFCPFCMDIFLQLYCMIHALYKKCKTLYNTFFCNGKAISIIVCIRNPHPRDDSVAPRCYVRIRDSNRLPASKPRHFAPCGASQNHDVGPKLNPSWLRVEPRVRKPGPRFWVKASLAKPDPTYGTSKAP